MKVILEHAEYLSLYKEENDNKDSDGLIAKGAKMAYGAVKNKLVSMLTGT